MPRLFGLDIAGIVNTSFASAGNVLPATLIKVTAGARGTNVTSGRTTTRESFSARGFIDDYTDRELEASGITAEDRRITLLGASITGGQIPERNDEITIESRTYKIIRVQRDPAAATYTCQAR